MAEKTISTRQKQKYDTSSNWTANNIVLLAGEIGIESDTNKFKVGNGTSAWNELDYAGGGDLILYSTTGQNTDGAMTQKAVTDAIPTTLSDLNEDSSHRTVTDAEKTTWNNKSTFSGSYNDLTNKPTIPTININGASQSTINFDSDPQTQIDNIVNNTTLIQNNNGGFSAGYNAVIDSSSYGGGAIGRDSYARSGGAIGYESYTTSGGAVGVGAHSEVGGAMGQDAYATQGGAIGNRAITSTGFAGGLSAQTVDSNGDGINAIQLGTGTNTQTKTLQVYDDNIYNANTHTLSVANIILNGSNIITHGSNSNGEYIQFYNGTQICIGTVTSEGTKTYARPFTANPVIVCGIINSSAANQISYRTMSAYNITSTKFHAQLTGSTSKTYIAMGKYK